MLLLPLVLLLGLSWPRPGPHPTTHIAHSPQKPLSLSPPPYWSQCHQLAHLRPRRPVTSCPATAPVSPRSLCCCLLLLLPASCFLPPAACCLLPAACCLLLFCSWDFLSSQYLPAFFFSCCGVLVLLACSSPPVPSQMRSDNKGHAHTPAVRQETKAPPASAISSRAARASANWGL